MHEPHENRGSFTACRENEGGRFGVVGRKSRQRVECVCLKHRFPFAATHQASTHRSLSPEAIAPAQAGALL